MQDAVGDLYKDCEVQQRGYTAFCDTVGDPTRGWCDWGGDAGGGIGPGCYNFVLGTSEHSDRGCIGFGTALFRCEDEAGCGAVNVLDLLPRAAMITGWAMAHEMTHSVINNSARWFDAMGGFPEGHGRLSGFLGEAAPEATFGLLYDDWALWDDRYEGSDPLGLGGLFGGDPVGGRNVCGGGEVDVEGDAFICPENPATCEEDRCAIPHPDHTCATDCERCRLRTRTTCCVAPTGPTSRSTCTAMARGSVGSWRDTARWLDGRLECKGLLRC